MKTESVRLRDYLVMLFLILMLIFVVLSPGGLGFLVRGLAHLFAGWYFYLSETIPNVQVKWSGVASFLFALLALFVLAHSFLQWIFRNLQTEGKLHVWRWTWTAKSLVIILLAFAAGICATGMVHQLGWLASSKEPLVHERLSNIFFNTAESRIHDK